VYFDDLKITHTPTNVIQYNGYYAYGLQTNTSWTREESVNKYLYNDGSELNATSGWYETAFRGYDAALGRFMQVDPLASQTHFMSAYQYANGNPILFNDPLGLKAYMDITIYWSPPDWSYNGPGSGNHWSDGLRAGYDDWHPQTGSDTYRAAKAAGAVDIGGKQYIVSGGQRFPVSESFGEAVIPVTISTYLKYSDGVVSDYAIRSYIEMVSVSEA
jgi:RHS repeat-associated protein